MKTLQYRIHKLKQDNFKVQKKIMENENITKKIMNNYQKEHFKETQLKEKKLFMHRLIMAQLSKIAFFKLKNARYHNINQTV